MMGTRQPIPWGNAGQRVHQDYIQTEFLEGARRVDRDRRGSI